MRYFSYLFLPFILVVHLSAKPELLILKNQLSYFKFLSCNKRGFVLPHEVFMQKKLNGLFDIDYIFKNMPSSVFVFTVRVLLDEKKSNIDFEWHFTSEGGFYICDRTQWTKTIYCKDKTLSVRRGKRGLFVNGKFLNCNQFSIEPAEGHLKFNDNFYDGHFHVVSKKDSYFLVNHLDIEDYIYSVLRWESWPGWPVEVNKAFAIACRSYLIAKVLQAKNNSDRCYHIKNTNIHQTYNGVHSSTGLQAAIDQTRGLVLAYEKKPIEAMFDSCCGGVVPADLADIDFKKAPYLKRTYPCTFCKACRIYSWQLEYSSVDIEKMFNLKGFSIKKIQNIIVAKKDLAGAPREIMVKSSGKNIVLTGRELYSIIKKIKSFCYTIEKKGNIFLFKGHGYGHHVGICQWGARTMVAQGWDFRSILHFYYPGCAIMELKNTAKS